MQIFLRKKKICSIDGRSSKSFSVIKVKGQSKDDRKFEITNTIFSFRLVVLHHSRPLQFYIDSPFYVCLFLWVLFVGPDLHRKLETRFQP